MPLAIVSFALEMIFLISTNAMSGTMSRGFAIFVIVVFVLCTITSLGCIFYNASHIKNSYVSKGVSVTGLVFSIVGAVLGLIRIMGNLQSLETIGIGIATAFVSTLYGVGLANLVLLPLAGNLKSKTREKILLKEVIIQGVMAIQMGENPAILQEKLQSYLKYHNHSGKVQQRIGLFK